MKTINNVPLSILKKTRIFLPALLSVTLLSGCGTIVKLIDPTEKYNAYAGTQYDWKQAQRWGLPILDLPLSFLLDSALLPYVWTQE